MILDIKDEEYLKGESVGTYAQAKILNEGTLEEIQTSDGKVKSVFNLLVNFKGKEITWTPNKTTLKELKVSWGEETKRWIGKMVDLTSVKQNVRGTMKDVIYGKAPKEIVAEKVEDTPVKRATIG